MLEIFAYKKWKKHKSDEALREAHAKEALSKQDEVFIRRSLSDDHEKAKPSFLKFGGKRTSEEKPTKEELDAINSKSGTYLTDCRTDRRDQYPNFAGGRFLPSLISAQPRCRESI